MTSKIAVPLWSGVPQHSQGNTAGQLNDAVLSVMLFSPAVIEAQDSQFLLYLHTTISF